MQIVFAFCIEKQNLLKIKNMNYNHHEFVSLGFGCISMGEILVKMGSSSSFGLLSLIQYAKHWIFKAARIDDSSDDDKEVRGGVEGMIGWALNSGV